MLKGKKIIITGAASGIGRATAVLAAEEGADIAIADIDRQGAEETAELVKARGQDSLVIEMDTSLVADAKRMVKDTVARFGTIDGIVCGAIKLRPAKLEDLELEDWDMVINIGALKNKDYELVKNDINLLAQTCHKKNTILKVIIETCLLSNEEKINVREW